MDADDADEVHLYETLLVMVRDEVDTYRKLQRAGKGIDLPALEKLARIYATLKDDLRSDRKDGIKKAAE